MRVIIIGAPHARALLMASLPDGIEVAGEARTLAEARESGLDADGWLLVTPDSPENDDERDTAVEPLTARELDVLELLAQGLSNKSIASRLGISDQTVKFHVASICGKLGAVNRTDAARRAIRQGLIPL
jgi:DNA-binding NarL/FixJ family response regulator